jgi:peptidoglycan/xylan/chitin deacetylase (PgdA/CDA1 family)
MAAKPRIVSKMFILSWLLVPIVALWVTTNYIIGLGQTPTWNVSSSQDNVPQTSSKDAPGEELVWNGEEGLVTLWFDDAWSSQYDIGLTTMEEFDFKGAMAVPTHAVNTSGYMNWAQLKLMQHKGWEMTSHSQTHNCDIPTLNEPFVEKELKGARDEMIQHGLFSDNYVAPCGAITPAVTTMAKRYYSSLRGSENGINRLPLTDPYYIKAHTILRESSIEDINAWIAEAKREKAWLIIVFHQIDNGTSEFGTDEGAFRNTLTAVKESGMPVVLPNQVMEMKVAR